ncbi:hypothetical protein LTR36_009924 [Oleoguttula mirabilis]|uniref:C2H2-type domain-containing protein n=1 Tax=Oleoguttula mirabilis TaxID=1507867 RepID=A0AAV9J523_9PEZI|nr:hypothetical protein LTR36_009924 [Oleoguttula mirabilis]
MDFTNHDDPLDSWDPVNGADWVEAALAALEKPCAAASEDAAGAGLRAGRQIPFLDVYGPASAEACALHIVAHFGLSMEASCTMTKLQSQIYLDTSGVDGSVAGLGAEAGFNTAGMLPGRCCDLICQRARATSASDRSFEHGADASMVAGSHTVRPSGDRHVAQVAPLGLYAPARADSGPVFASVHRTAPPGSTGFTAATTQHGTIVCPDINSIPSGRQQGKVPKCGANGCTSNALFDRKNELQRHMEAHDGSHPCLIVGCDRGMRKPFKRADKLAEHIRKVHGH